MTVSPLAAIENPNRLFGFVSEPDSLTLTHFCANPLSRATASDIRAWAEAGKSEKFTEVFAEAVWTNAPRTRAGPTDRKFDMGPPSGVCRMRNRHCPVVRPDSSILCKAPPPTSYSGRAAFRQLQHTG